MLTSMELRALRYFGVVVEAGSLTAAAQTLRLSQPSLSVAIAKLERDVGVALLVRSPRGVEPTSAGRFLLERSARLLGDVDDTVAALRRFGDGAAGHLTIAAVPTLMWHRVPRVLRSYAQAAPGVEVTLLDPPPWTAIEMLLARTVDLAAIVVADPERFAQRHRGTLDIVDWGEVPLVAVLPPDCADTRDPLPLHAFAGEQLVLPHRTAAVPSVPEVVEEALARTDVVPGVVRSVPTVQAGMPLIEAGLARAILADPDRASLGRFDVSVRRLDPEPPALRALVLARAGGSADLTVARFLTHLADERR